MRKERIAKRITLCLCAMFMLVFCTTPALAADYSPGGNLDVVQNKQRRANVTHSLDMQKIVVRPTYKTETGVLKTLPGYYYNRSGNFKQSIFCTVSSTAKASMEQKVVDAGYTQTGYEITVYYTVSGTYRDGGVVTRKPANIPYQPISAGIQAHTTFYTSISSPAFKWDGYFMDEAGRSSLITAGVDFE